MIGPEGLWERGEREEASSPPTEGAEVLNIVHTLSAGAMKLKGERRVIFNNNNNNYSTYMAP